MASIFLSYARDDSAKAQALAKWLERADHSVWWDRHIHGGSEYAGEIEAALNGADVVIVLWSEAAGHSAWVRDEAAEGRDSGRLIPLVLDASPPPLGFRQLQSISIAGWSGRGNPPEFLAIKAAIERIGGAPHKKARAATAVAGPSRRTAVGLIAAMLLLLAGATAWLLLKGSASNAEPVVAVLPFSDLSPAKDKAFLAEGVAEAILTGLAKEQGIKVIGRSSAAQLQSAGAGAPKMRKAMGITHVLEGSARSIGDQLRMSVRLVDAQDGSQVWAEEYHRKLDNIFAVQDEIGRAVAVKLRGSIGGAPAASAAEQATSADAYTLYLAARGKMRTRETQSLKEALTLAQKAIAADPRYAPAHAIYAELLVLLSFDNYGTLAPERARALALPHARKAVTLAPQASEGHAALGMVQDGAASIGPLERAIQLDPARAELRMWLSGSLQQVGRNADALRQIEAAEDMDPLLFPIVANHAYILGASGKAGEAAQVLRRYEQRGGSKARAAKTLGDIAGWRGDLSEGVRLTRLAVSLDPRVPLGAISLAWFQGLLALDREAAQAARSLPRYSRLFVVGRFDDVVDVARKDGARVWQEADYDVAIDAFALRRQWADIVRLLDVPRSGRRATCDDNRPWMLQSAIHIALALRQTGRGGEAQPILTCVKRSLARTGAGPVRTQYLSNAQLDLLNAEIEAIEGRPGPALQRIEQAIAGGFRTRHGTGLSSLAAFDPLHPLPRYRALDAQMRQLVAKEREEALLLPAKTA